MKSFLKAWSNFVVDFLLRVSVYFMSVVGASLTQYFIGTICPLLILSLYSRLPFPISHCLLFLILFFLIINHIPLQSIFFKDFDRTLNMRFHRHHHHYFLTMGLFSFPVQGSLEVLSIFLKFFLVNFKAWNY